MDWLTLVSEVIKSLAWPVTTFAIFLIVRLPLVALIPHTQEVRFRDFVWKIGRTLDQAEDRADRAGLPDAAVTPTAIAAETEALAADLIAVSPRAAVLEAWTRLEAAIRRSIGLTTTYRPAKMLTQILREKQLLGQDAIATIEDLRALRNQVAHNPQVELDPGQAREYIRLAERLVSALAGPTTDG